MDPSHGEMVSYKTRCFLFCLIIFFIERGSFSYLWFFDVIGLFNFYSWFLCITSLFLSDAMLDWRLPPLVSGGRVVHLFLCSGISFNIKKIATA